ncbi:spore cortex-lytic enzyme, partial [Coprococcus sp. MSK.21.13]|nr:spore cortex-lytic enzyme [Coprococcus sp. MSK.21.13]
MYFFLFFGKNNTEIHIINRECISMKNRRISLKKGIVYFLIAAICYSATYAFFRPYNKALNVIAYNYGSRGDNVSEIQRKLKNWGYYDGEVDGIYGYRTFLAVKKFQGKNGLTVDGVAGNKTLAALGINVAQSQGSNTSNNQDIN